MLFRMVVSCVLVTALWLPAPACQEEGLPELQHCPVPVAPCLDHLHLGATLSFVDSEEPGAQLEVALAAAGSHQPAKWLAGSDLGLTTQGEAVLFARRQGCPDGWFRCPTTVVADYPPPAGEPGSTAVALDDPAIKGWAAEVVRVALGENVSPEWQVAAQALGAAQGETGEVVSLGCGGTIDLLFEPPIADGPGFDLAIFENGINDAFLELARVEVSSDGELFVPFDSVYLNTAPVPAFGGHDCRLFYGLAGRYRLGFGTPFDLATLVNRTEVVAGLLDLQQVRFVRVVDIIGDGREEESFGNAIFDPFPTTGSAGFDLDGAAALNASSGR